MYTYKNVTLKEIKKSVSRVVVRRNIKQLQRREREIELLSPTVWRG